MITASPYMTEFGYNPITTFWTDFTIADELVKAEPKIVREIFNDATIYAKTDYKIFTELVMVLNHKMWIHHELGDKELSKHYMQLWEEAERIFDKTFKNNKEAQHYYYTTLD